MYFSAASVGRRLSDEHPLHYKVEYNHTHTIFWVRAPGPWNARAILVSCGLHIHMSFPLLLSSRCQLSPDLDPTDEYTSIAAAVHHEQYDADYFAVQIAKQPLRVLTTTTVVDRLPSVVRRPSPPGSQCVGGIQLLFVRGLACDLRFRWCMNIVWHRSTKKHIYTAKKQLYNVVRFFTVYA